MEPTTTDPDSRAEGGLPAPGRPDLGPAPLPPEADGPPQAELEPAERFLAVAATAPPGDGFKPTAAHEKIAQKLFESQAGSFLQLAEAAGVDRVTIWRTLKNPKACEWIVNNAARAVEFGLPAVHSRLLNMALTSRSSSFMELYLRRFDPEFKKGAAAGSTTINAQYAMIQAMGPAELENFIKQKRRKEGIEPQGS